MKKLWNRLSNWLELHGIVIFVMCVIAVALEFYGMYQGYEMGYQDGHKKTSRITSIEVVREHAYIANIESGVYHKNSCWTLPNDDKCIYFDELTVADTQGYRPCGNCNP